MTRLRVVVDRKRWIRGGFVGRADRPVCPPGSLLLNPEPDEQNRCCVGFAAEQGGLADELTRGMGQIENVCNAHRIRAAELHPALARLVEPSRWGVLTAAAEYRATTAALDLYGLNDIAGTAMTEQEREVRIKAAGEKIGIDYVFTG